MKIKGGVRYFFTGWEKFVSPDFTNSFSLTFLNIVNKYNRIAFQKNLLKESKSYIKIT